MTKCSIPTPNEYIELLISISEKWTVRAECVHGGLCADAGWDDLSQYYGLKFGYFKTFRHVHTTTFNLYMCNAQGVQIDYCEQENDWCHQGDIVEIVVVSNNPDQQRSFEKMMTSAYVHKVPQ